MCYVLYPSLISYRDMLHIALYSNVIRTLNNDKLVMKIFFVIDVAVLKRTVLKLMNIKVIICFFTILLYVNLLFTTKLFQFCY